MNKNDIQINRDKIHTMKMYDWIANRRTCFDGLGLNSTAAASMQLQKLEKALTPFSAMRDGLYDREEDPYVDGVKPYYDILAALSSVEPPLASGDHELCVLNVCREGHTGHLCSVCKPGYAKQLSNGICYHCEGTDLTLWWRPPLMYFLVAWTMMKKSCNPHDLKSSVMPSFIFFFQTTALVSAGTNWFGQKQSLHPQLLEYLTSIKLYFNLEFDKTSACPINVYVRFYYDVFYTPAMVICGLYMAFGAWWLFVRANSKFNIIGGAWKLIHKISFGKLGAEQMKKHWRRELQFHKYQSQRAHWLVYLYIYAPLTRKCSAVFFCRDDVTKGASYMNSDISASCDDAEYYVMFICAVVMFTVIGFVVPLTVAWKLYYNPHHWHVHDQDQRIFSVGDYVAFRPPRIYYSGIQTGVTVDVDAKLANFLPGTAERAALEIDVQEKIAGLFGIDAHRISTHRIKVTEKREFGQHDDEVLKEGKLHWLDGPKGTGVWRKCHASLDGKALSWKSTMVIPMTRAQEGRVEKTTLRLLPTTVEVCRDNVAQSAEEDAASADHGYRFEVMGEDMTPYYFCAKEDTDRLAWVETLHKVTQTGDKAKVNLLESGQVKSRAARLSAGQPTKCLCIHLQIETEKRGHDPHDAASHLQCNVDCDALDSLTVAGHSVRSVTVSNRAPHAGGFKGVSDPLGGLARLPYETATQTFLRGSLYDLCVDPPHIQPCGPEGV
jgi:hypothetical protein